MLKRVEDAVFDKAWIEVIARPQVEAGDGRRGVSEGQDPVDETREPAHFGAVVGAGKLVVVEVKVWEGDPDVPPSPGQGAGLDGGCRVEGGEDLVEDGVG